jgi:hypothetical protein
MTNEQVIRLDLPLSRVNAILGILGELPSKSGVWVLIEEIRNQALPQIPEVPAPAPAPVEKAMDE